MERSKFVEDIREAIRVGKLTEPFRANDVRKACPRWAENKPSVFLPKHRRGNPGKETEHFVRVARGLYTLIEASEVLPISTRTRFICDAPLHEDRVKEALKKMANDERFERAKNVLSELSEEDRVFIIDFLLSHNYPSIATFSLAVAKINRNRYPLFRAFRTLNKLSELELMSLMSLDRYAQNGDQRSRDDDMIYRPPTREELPE